MLTMECKGKLKPARLMNDSLARINNSFKVVTDSISPNGDSIRTKKILIDKDPPNASFSQRLSRDRIRAIAWQEYAGWGHDDDHCHEHMATGIKYNPRWNHYWDYFVRTNGDTCWDTRTPCENSSSDIAKDTGIMQIFRTEWEAVFDSSYVDPGYPMTFRVCRWDSLAWNWKICIENGRWIFEEAMPAKMVPAQEEFPESCSYADCDSVPDTANQEDLANYGYHAGEGNMRRIKSQALWETYINSPADTAEIERANYIKWVRRYKYRGNLW
jgi:hypothetical protein